MHTCKFWKIESICTKLLAPCQPEEKFIDFNWESHKDPRLGNLMSFFALPTNFWLNTHDFTIIRISQRTSPMKIYGTRQLRLGPGQNFTEWF